MGGIAGLVGSFDMGASAGQRHNKIFYFLGVLAAYAIVFMLFGRSDTSNLYYMLSRAFLSGRVYIARVHPEILALPNPYDPDLNTSVRIADPGEVDEFGIRDGIFYGPRREDATYIGKLHDGTLFNGNWYTYYGPLNALLLAPSAALNIPINDSWLVLFWSAVFGVAAAGLMSFADRLLKSSTHQFRTTYGLRILPYLYFGMCLNFGILSCLARPMFYEAAIMGGTALFTLGISQILRCISCSGSTFLFKSRPIVLMSASACIAAAVASRFSYVIPATALGLLVIAVMLRTERTNCWLGLMAFCVPAALVMLALALYNHARFGSPFETGWNFVTPGLFDLQKHVEMYGLLNFHNFPTDFYAYFLSGFARVDHFPYFALSKASFYAPNNWFTEGHPSMFVVMPLLGLSVAVLAILGSAQLMQKFVSTKPGGNE